MARTVNPQEHHAKRSEILDATQRLVFSKGYDQISIQDILDEVQISSGAFHHYFGSREALLEAFIERIKEGTEKPLLPILHDPQLSAVEKLQGFFDTLDRLRTSQKADVVRLAHVWYTDDNAVVRMKVDEGVIRQRAPLLNEVVRQGIGEGIFTNAYPDLAGEVILYLLQAMGNSHARLLLSAAWVKDDGSGDPLQDFCEEIVTIHAAYMDAIERLLGVPANSFHRTDAEAVKVWIDAMRENVPPKD